MELMRYLLAFLRPALLLRWTALLVGCTAAWLYLNINTLQEYMVESSRLEDYRSKVEDLQHNQAQLIQMCKDLENCDYQTEKTIRERLLMVKPGEQIIFIEEPQFDVSPQVKTP